MSKTYSIPLSNVGTGSFITFGSKRYHVPSWTQVEEDTTMNDIAFFKAVPKEERKEEKWKFKSSKGDKTYTVKYNIHGALSCDCWGYIGHRKCKHIKNVKEKLEKV
jgi:hypothetical protein